MKKILKTEENLRRLVCEVSFIALPKLVRNAAQMQSEIHLKSILNLELVRKNSFELVHTIINNLLVSYDVS